MLYLINPVPELTWPCFIVPPPHPFTLPPPYKTPVDVALVGSFLKQPTSPGPGLRVLLRARPLLAVLPPTWLLVGGEVRMLRPSSRFASSPGFTLWVASLSPRALHPKVSVGSSYPHGPGASQKASSGTRESSPGFSSSPFVLSMALESQSMSSNPARPLTKCVDFSKFLNLSLVFCKLRRLIANLFHRVVVRTL